MRVSLLPKAIFQKLTDITPEYLCACGIRLLMLDFDNTVLPYTSNEPTETLLAWLERMKAADVMLCVVSNSKKSRAKNFCEQNQIGCVRHARKPFPKGIKECLRRYDAAPEQAALVGDQIFTDVLGANGVGVRSILVKPIHLHNIWLKLRHVAEQPCIYFARNRRVKL